jgi:RNase P subunit RPR2
VENEKLIGEVDISAEYVGNLQPDFKKLASHLESGAARVFCKGCGAYAEIDKEGAKALTARAQGRGIEDIKPELYFVATRCYKCGEEDRFEEPVIMPIQ